MPSGPSKTTRKLWERPVKTSKHVHIRFSASTPSTAVKSLVLSKRSFQQLQQSFHSLQCACWYTCLHCNDTLVLAFPLSYVDLYHDHREVCWMPWGLCEGHLQHGNATSPKQCNTLYFKHTGLWRSAYNIHHDVEFHVFWILHRAFCFGDPREESYRLAQCQWASANQCDLLTTGMQTCHPPAPSHPELHHGNCNRACPVAIGVPGLAVSNPAWTPSTHNADVVVSCF